MSSSTRAAVTYAMTGLLIAIGLVEIVPPMFAPETARACGECYPNTTLFWLERGGALITLDEMRTRVGDNLALGLRDNVEIMKPRDARIPAAMQVSLRGNPGTPGRSPDTGAGLAFPWQVRAIQKETATCLSYNVFFYADLEFQNGGTLPGIEGADRSEASRDGFAANLAWSDDGHVGVRLSVITDGESASSSLEAKDFTFPRARWVKIDQEVVLNSPGESDGVLRIWMDGDLALERKDIAYRSKPEVGLNGVAAKVFYGAPDAIAWAPSETTIWISPLELGWHQ
jgi:hypothetical protein